MNGGCFDVTHLLMEVVYGSCVAWLRLRVVVLLLQPDWLRRWTANRTDGPDCRVQPQSPKNTRKTVKKSENFIYNVMPRGREAVGVLACLTRGLASCMCEMSSRATLWSMFVEWSVRSEELLINVPSAYTADARTCNETYTHVQSWRKTTCFNVRIISEQVYRTSGILSLRSS